MIITTDYYDFYSCHFDDRERKNQGRPASCVHTFADVHTMRIVAHIICSFFFCRRCVNGQFTFISIEAHLWIFSAHTFRNESSEKCKMNSRRCVTCESEQSKWHSWPIETNIHLHTRVSTGEKKMHDVFSLSNKWWEISQLRMQRVLSG